MFPPGDEDHEHCCCRCIIPRTPVRTPARANGVAWRRLGGEAAPPLCPALRHVVRARWRAHCGAPSPVRAQRSPSGYAARVHGARGRGRQRAAPEVGRRGSRFLTVNRFPVCDQAFRMCPCPPRAAVNAVQAAVVVCRYPRPDYTANLPIQS